MAILHDVYLNRIERLAKLIGVQQREHELVLQDRVDLRVARDAAVQELRQVKAERDQLRKDRQELKTDWDRLCHELTEAHGVVFGSGVTPVSVANLVNEIERLRERVRSANGRVDLANLDNASLREKLAASGDSGELERLRGQLAAAQREASEEFAERQVLQAEASPDSGELERLRAIGDTLRAHLQSTVAQALVNLNELGAPATLAAPASKPEPNAELENLTGERDRLAKDFRSMQDISASANHQLFEAARKVWPGQPTGDVKPSHFVEEIQTLRAQLADAKREASEEFVERQVLQAEASDDYGELERLREFVGKVRGHLHIHGPNKSLYQYIKGSVAELDTPTNPAPASEPTGGAE